MIFNRHVTDRLAPYLDGLLDHRTRERVDAHLSECLRCRSDLDQIRIVQSILQEIPQFEAPASLWTAIESAAPSRPTVRPTATLMWRYALVISVAALAGYLSYSRQSAVRWEVVALDGVPLAGEERIAAKLSVPTGGWIETDARSRARIQVGEIGSVEVEPNTRVRLLASAATEHRLALLSGGISAKISAPPRLFVVDTPAATAVDLGCEYRIECDRAGKGILNVQQGWVSLEWRGTESLVPAGASCLMRPTRGPGTPWFDDAAAELIDALRRFDFDPKSGPDEVETILARSRARDTLTLWHLLSRVQTRDRSRVYERMTQFAAPPAGITREKILALDRESLTRWKDELAWTW